MEVRNVRWVGIYTHHYREMVRLLRDTMGLAVNFEEKTTVEFKTSEGDQIQVLAPEDPYYQFFKEQPTGLSRCSRWTMSIRLGLNWWMLA